MKLEQPRLEQPKLEQENPRLEESHFPAPDHDHGHCIADALVKAGDICTRSGARLTSLRKSVLEFVWESHAPVGAYDILERMSAGGRRTAPITVYRALDFLISQGLVHRLESLNAYTGCGVPDVPHGAHFLICGDCGTVAELCDTEIDRAIARGADQAGFAVRVPVVEIKGRCPECRNGEA